MDKFDEIPAAIQASDLLEQIARVNRMIALHEGNDFMRQQYEDLQQDFLNQLNEVLRGFQLKPTEIAV
jgi:hypothetical protein